MELLELPATGLAGLFISSFLSATLLPGSSELVLFAVLRLHPEQLPAALALATLGNTLGGMTTWGMARLLPQHALERFTTTQQRLLRRWGSAALLLSWAPFVGDGLCTLAGWLRLPALPCLVWMSLGKGLRYAVIAAGALAG